MKSNTGDGDIWFSLCPITKKKGVGHCVSVIVCLHLEQCLKECIVVKLKVSGIEKWVSCLEVGNEKEQVCLVQTCSF